MLYRYSPLISEEKVQQLMHKAGRASLLLGDTEKCEDGIKWILNLFGDCVDTTLKAMGFGIGLVSLLLWLVPLIPQLYENYKNKRCEGLSIYFLLFWIFGDACNMIGAVLTHQQPLQQVIGVYYILQDFVMLGQYVYYTQLYQSNRQNLMVGSTIVVPVFLFGFFGLSSLFSSNAAVNDLNLQPGRSLRSLSEMSLFGNKPPQTVDIPPIFESYSDVAGYVIGSLAALSYFAGRIPQLMRNYYRKSVDGLSVSMFYIIVVANLTYGLSVLLESTGWIYLLRHLPWLAGSLGCCAFDVCLIGQIYYYGRKNALAGARDEHEGLLEEGEEHED